MGRSNDELLLEYLEANDALCPICGYNLRQLTRTTCPECGRLFILEVGSASPYFGQYIACLAPFIATAAIGVLFVCLVIMWGPPGSWGVYFIMLAGGVDLILLTHWYRKRVSFQTTFGLVGDRDCPNTVPIQGSPIVTDRNSKYLTCVMQCLALEDVMAPIAVCRIRA